MKEIKAFVNGFLGIFLLVAAIVAVFTYLPEQLDTRYTSPGQVVRMVNPTGNNPMVDSQYAGINTQNAGANKVNAEVYIYHSAVWVGWAFMVLMVFLFFWAIIARNTGAPPKI